MSLDDIFDAAELNKVSTEHAGSYAGARPFPHAVIDGLFPDHVLERVLEEFPGPDEIEWIRYDRRGYENKKMESLKGEQLPPFTRFLFYQFNSAPFITFLESLTGITGLIPDPHFWGGGLHQVANGGYLKVHADFNMHPTLGIQRKVNVLIYLNKGWKEEYGGQLELWDEEMSACQARIMPVFNRCVIFNTNDRSFHGHPDPITCPDSVLRRSIALYYYTKVEEASSDIGGTNWKFRPDEKAPSAFREVAAKFIPPIVFDARRKLLTTFRTKNGR